MPQGLVQNAPVESCELGIALSKVSNRGDTPVLEGALAVRSGSTGHYSFPHSEPTDANAFHSDHHDLIENDNYLEIDDDDVALGNNVTRLTVAGRHPQIDQRTFELETEAELERIRYQRLGYADHPNVRRKPKSSFGSFSLYALILLGLALSGVIALYIYSPDDYRRVMTKIQNATLFAGQSVPASLTDMTSAMAQSAPAKSAAPAPSKTAPLPPAPAAAPAVNAPAQAVQPAQPAVNAQPVTTLQANGTSPLAKSLFEMGALSCISRANQISNFLSNGSEAVVLQKPVGNPDKSLLMATLLPTVQNKTQDVAIVSLSPNQTSGCEGNYQSIRVIEKPCANAVAETYGAAKALAVGTSGISIVPLNQSGRVFAIPAGNSCVMIKQEMVQ